MLAAVPLRYRDDQLLADVARKVEVDVRDRRHLVVQEPPQREVRGYRVDVREAGQVADERTDARTAASPRRQHVPRRSWAAHLERALARKFEHFPVQQEETRQPEPRDQRQLLVEPLPRPSPLHHADAVVASPESALADFAKLLVGRIGPIREVRIAVPELLCQIERAAIGDLPRALGGCTRQPLQHLLRRAEDGFLVPAPLPLGAVEGGAVRDRDQRILESRPALVVRVDVPGCDRRHAEGCCEALEGRVSARVASLEWPLELDVERAGERAREIGCRLRIDAAEPLPRAAGEADEPFGVLGDELRGRSRWQQVAAVPSRRRNLPVPPSPFPVACADGRLRRPGSCVRVREDPAKVRVAALALAEERDVRAAGERHLSTGDCAHPEALARVGELERPVDAVVVGQGEGVVAELRGARCELFRQRGAVEERVGRVGVQLDVGSGARGRRPPIPSPHPPRGRRTEGSGGSEAEVWRDCADSVPIARAPPPWPRSGERPSVIGSGHVELRRHRR